MRCVVKPQALEMHVRCQAGSAERSVRRVEEVKEETHLSSLSLTNETCC